MSRKNKPLSLLEQIEITGIAAEGKAFARLPMSHERYPGLVVFVPYCAPGDVVDLQLTRKKHSYAEAEARTFHKRSDMRIQPFCPHYGICGGCRWQHISYADQLAFKQQQVVDALTRIGHVELPDVCPIKGSRQVAAYRGKLEFSCAPRRWLTREEIAQAATFPPEALRAIGFHMPGSFDKVLDIRSCYLMHEVNNHLRNDIRAYAIEHDLSFYNLHDRSGLLRSVMVRRSETTGELMLLIQFNMEESDAKAQAESLLEHLAQNFPEITSLLWVDNRKCNDTFADLPVHTYAGRDFIWETMENLRFKVGPKSFYQTNAAQAYELYKVVRRFAALTGEELVYDLYTGTGTIACFLANSARSVVGIEYVPEAIEDARENAATNGLDNTFFIAGDMKDVLTADFLAAHGSPDVLVTDPPRAGMHPAVVDTIMEAAPPRIVYVSCNPATQARDLLLLDPKYRIEAIQPVDMFPHTQHVENVVLLTRRQ